MVSRILGDFTRDTRQSQVFSQARYPGIEMIAPLHLLLHPRIAPGAPMELDHIQDLACMVSLHPPRHSRSPMLSKYGAFVLSGDDSKSCAEIGMTAACIGDRRIEIRL